MVTIQTRNYGVDWVGVQLLLRWVVSGNVIMYDFKPSGNQTSKLLLRQTNQKLVLKQTARNRSLIGHVCCVMVAENVTGI